MPNNIQGEADIRSAALEEAAKVCDFNATWAKGEGDDAENRNRSFYYTQQAQSERDAYAIRALKGSAPPKVQGAAPTDLHQAIMGLTHNNQDPHDDYGFYGSGFADCQRRAAELAALAAPDTSGESSERAPATYCPACELNVFGPCGSVDCATPDRATKTAEVGGIGDDQFHRLLNAMISCHVENYVNGGSVEKAQQEKIAKANFIAYITNFFASAPAKPGAGE